MSTSSERKSSAMSREVIRRASMNRSEASMKRLRRELPSSIPSDTEMISNFDRS